MLYLATLMTNLRRLSQYLSGKVDGTTQNTTLSLSMPIFYRCCGLKHAFRLYFRNSTIFSPSTYLDSIKAGFFGRANNVSQKRRRYLIELALFDMDHTVLGVDCDHSWKYFLADEGFSPPAHRDEADRFLDLYHKDRVPVNEFIEFQLSEFTGRSITEIQTIADRHFEQRIKKHIYTQAREVIDKFNHDGIDSILLTGTNRIIANPIAKSLGVSRLIATEPELEDGFFTGRIDGPFLMKEAKFESAEDLCLNRNIDLDNVTYFADSITDVPLLEKVGYPVVINPRKDMLSIAKANQWQIRYWHNESQKTN